MNAKKDTKRWFISILLLLAIYLIIVLLIPINRTVNFWISLVFTLIAFFLNGLTGYKSFIIHKEAKSRFYGFPVVKIAVFYGIVQLILGSIVMCTGVLIPVWLSIIVFCTLLGFSVIGLISADSVVEQINNQDEAFHKNVSLMRSLQSKLSQMATQCDSEEIRADIYKLAQEFRFSDPVSNDTLEDVERDLSAAIEELQDALIERDIGSAKSLCKKVSGILSERNRLCKLNKR